MPGDRIAYVEVGEPVERRVGSRLSSTRAGLPRAGFALAIEGSAAPTWRDPHEEGTFASFIGLIIAGIIIGLLGRLVLRVGSPSASS